MIHYHAAYPQFGGNSTITVVAMVFNGDFLDGRSNCDFFRFRLFCSKAPVKAGTADLGERAHPFHT
jgi:hypothetical protein